MKKIKEKKNIETCDVCKKVGYLWEHENGDNYYFCPLHWYESFSHDIDQTIRDCWPINWKLTKKEQEVINYIRGEVNGLLSRTSVEYKLFSKRKKNNP